MDLIGCWRMCRVIWWKLKCSPPSHSWMRKAKTRAWMVRVDYLNPRLSCSLQCVIVHKKSSIWSRTPIDWRRSEWKHDRIATNTLEWAIPPQNTLDSAVSLSIVEALLVWTSQVIFILPLHLMADSSYTNAPGITKSNSNNKEDAFYHIETVDHHVTPSVVTSSYRESSTGQTRFAPILSIHFLSLKSLSWTQDGVRGGG